MTPADLLPVPLNEDTASIRMRGSHEDHRGNDHDPYGDPRGKHSGSSARGIGMSHAGN